MPCRRAWTKIPMRCVLAARRSSILSAHAEDADGGDALSDEDAAEGGDRDGAARAPDHQGDTEVERKKRPLAGASPMHRLMNAVAGALLLPPSTTRSAIATKANDHVGSSMKYSRDRRLSFYRGFSSLSFTSRKGLAAQSTANLAELRSLGVREPQPPL
jgi:hypothetical protein